MFQLLRHIQTKFLGKIFAELFQFTTRSLFGTIYTTLNEKNSVLYVNAC